ncbi:hypothetical protein CAPTEDRAFT_157710 [Capitella teleta]|uniref:Swi5-dependent recombination DNA repair protein 1 homolog n=1 Tax=Capitella teleta TaxID=283909 RepID=R7U616_CAPTE|nr:hypothetical protein CAPTEDRAFT_157710 [Capitella teleta]|eukprot:ELU01810.1 hypothetical protein CAPTEDRAFT_157710 [Capitella teleta]
MADDIEKATPSKRKKTSLDDGIPSKRALRDNEQSPATPVQSQISEEINADDVASSIKITDNHISCDSSVKPSVDNLSHLLSSEDLRKQRTALLSEIHLKEEKLRKLTLVKLYRSKNDLSELDDLTNKWRAVCQEAVVNLHERLSIEPKPSLSDFIGFLQIDPVQLRFDKDQEDFM